MRVTDAMIFFKAAAAATAARDRLQQATDEVSSGLRVVQPGDDPVASGLCVIDRQQQARQAAINATLDRLDQGQRGTRRRASRMPRSPAKPWRARRAVLPV